MIPLAKSLESEVARTSSSVWGLEDEEGLQNETKEEWLHGCEENFEESNRERTQVGERLPLSCAADSPG